MALGMQISNVSLTINNFSISVGNDIYVPILVDSPSEISAFGFDAEFPSDKLIFVGLERTALRESYNHVDANVISREYAEAKAGKKQKYSTLRVGGYKTGLKFSAFSGVLLTLIFRVERNLAEEAPLTVIATYDDFKNASVKNGLVGLKKSQNEREDPAKDSVGRDWTFDDIIWERTNLINLISRNAVN
jgi:hypothetical protein